MKTALVTGGNRGIGLEIAKQLDQKGFQVIIGCRDIEQGAKAIKGLSDRMFVTWLDVTESESAPLVYKKINQEFGVLDVLINNAGIGEYPRPSGVLSTIKNLTQEYTPGIISVAKDVVKFLQGKDYVYEKHSASNVEIDHVKKIMETNLFGVWRVTQTMIPLLKKSNDPRIINISSGMGELMNLTGHYPAYSISKASLNALTIMFAKELEKDNIKVNAMCPGWVKTEMGGPKAPRTVQEGADTAVWLATEPEIPTGQFFKDRTIVNW